MLLEMAVADAYGIAFEFVKDYDAHGLKNDLTFQQNPRYPELRPSQYTDDTLRSIATWRAITSRASSASPFNPETYGEHILLEYMRDRRPGWSKRFQKYLHDHVIEERHAHPRKFLRGISTRKESNGSIMGCLPCGVLHHPVDVRLAASTQALATHSAATIPFAQAMALSAHYFIYDLGPPRELEMFLENEVEGWSPNFDSVWHGPMSDIDMSAKKTAYAVLCLLYHGTSLTGIMKEAIKVGGDTDSVAALAVGIASCSADYENDIPQSMIDALDNGGTWGADYLRDIDSEMTRYIKQVNVL